MTKLEIFAQRLKQAREEKGLTVRELAEMINTSAATISRYENAIHEPKSNTIALLAEKLGVNPAWLMGADVDKYEIEESKRKPAKLIPILGAITCGEPILAVENIEGYEYADDDSDFCLIARGDSMINARIYDGDLVFVRRQDDVDSGDIAVVLIDDEATIKRVIKANGTLILQPENPQYSPIVITKKDKRAVRILGKVIAVKFKVR